MLEHQDASQFPVADASAACPWLWCFIKATGQRRMQHSDPTSGQLKNNDVCLSLT